MTRKRTKVIISKFPVIDNLIKLRQRSASVEERLACLTDVRHRRPNDLLFRSAKQRCTLKFVLKPIYLDRARKSCFSED
jgi:hypothetical protein